MITTDGKDQHLASNASVYTLAQKLVRESPESPNGFLQNRLRSCGAFRARPSSAAPEETIELC